MLIFILALQIVILLILFAGKWFGTDGLTMQDRIDLVTIVRRTKTIMAQLDDLIGILQAIGTDVGQKAQQMLTLEQKLTDINNSTPPSVDLQPAIDLATSIRQSLETTAASASTATQSDGTQGQTPAPSGGDTTGVGSGAAQPDSGVAQGSGTGGDPSGVDGAVSGDGGAPASDNTGTVSGDGAAPVDPSQPQQ